MCGVACPGRVHHYWDCPVAVAVMESVLSELPAAWCTRPVGRPPLTMRHVWLMQRPAGPKKLHCGVWRVVCLAALNAMDVGRKHATKLSIPPPAPDLQQPPVLPQGQARITTFFQPAALTASQQQHAQLLAQRRQQQELHLQQQRQHAVAQVLQEAKQQAVLRFWELLADFVAMEAAPANWRVAVPVDHPFLCSDPAQLRVILAPRSG